MRERAALDFQCDEGALDVTELPGSGYRVSGCGESATYVCTGGPFSGQAGVGPNGVPVAGPSAVSCVREASSQPAQANGGGCPAGMLPVQGVCRPVVDTRCPAGLAFVAGRGCVATLPKGARAADRGEALGPDACPQGTALVRGGAFEPAALERKVDVSAFCLDRTEVTVRAYAACVARGACDDRGLPCGSAAPGEREKSSGRDAANWGVAGREEHPVNCVTFEQAETFCRAAGGRLPSEAEWEWAARGGAAGRRYAWGDDAPGDRTCWSGATRRGTTCPVGSFAAGSSAAGIADLTGNVWEWTSSRVGPHDSSRVTRGGSFSATSEQYLRVTERYWVDPTARATVIGFRCASTPTGAARTGGADATE